LICVADVGLGLFEQYNENLKAAERVKFDDFIVKVNGFHGHSAVMLEEMKQAVRLDMLMKRSTELCVALVKKEERKKSFGIRLPSKEVGNAPSDSEGPAEEMKKALGLQFTGKILGNTLLISHVDSEGAAQDWNASNPTQKIKKGDRIVAVNGQR